MLGVLGEDMRRVDLLIVVAVTATLLHGTAAQLPDSKNEVY